MPVTHPDAIASFITRVNPDGSSVTNYIDLYHARHFVLETKQGVSDRGGDDPSPSSLSAKTGHGKRGTAAFDRALERAFHQGRGYITSLSVAEGRPPFLIFGTLLTRALDPRERHKLGAEYTPRSG